MTYDQMIHEYLDTGLNGAEEDALFQALAQDQSLRGEFEQQLSMMKIASNDMNNISPPIESTNAVFSSLGFSIPSGSTEAPVSEGSRKPGASIFASASGVSILSVFSDNLSTLASVAIAATISTLLFMNFDMKLNNGNSELTGVTLAQNYYDDASHSEIPIVSASDNTLENNNNQSYSSNGASNNVASIYSENDNANNSTIITERDDNEDLASLENEYLESNSSIQKETSSSFNQDISSNGYARVKVNMINHESQPVVPLSIDNGNYIEDAGFAVELRGGSNPNQNELLNDMMIGVNFEIVDDLHAIGLIGSEQYVVRTSNPLTPNEQVTYNNESMTSFNLGLRYAPDELILSGLITPYVQITGGGLSNGFAMGAESGLMFNLNNTYSIMVGYGANYAKYNFESRLYNTSKNGINFGMRYSF
ncbi:MAG: hypothetical protein ACE364_10720 [Chlorobiota bacterium]